MGFSADIALTKSRAISKLPSTATATAPCMSAWESLPHATFPSGISPTHRSPVLHAGSEEERRGGLCIRDEVPILIAGAILEKTRLVRAHDGDDVAHHSRAGGHTPRSWSR